MRIIKIPMLFLLRLLKGSLIVRAVLDCAPGDWRRATLSIFSSAVGGFMPIWGAFFLLRLHRVTFQWADFARHGEFGLYAAAFLAPAIYQILRSIKRDKFPLQAGSVLVGLVGILLAAFIYAGVSPQLGASAAAQYGVIDESYLLVVSGSLLSLALVFSFLVTLIDISVNDPDLGAAETVDRAFLQAAVAMDQPEGVPSIVDMASAPDENIPSNDDLKRQFNAARAGKDVDG